ncbi:MAG: HIT domain-containing protein [Salinibacterium sp.]|nr:HIT domain-containing protein [Salinibacterium sp.]
MSDEHGTTGQPALFAPWRLEYLEALDKNERSSGVPQAGSWSFLLDAWNTPDADDAHHVIVRTDHGMVLLNAYPYANGHLLVALGDARPTLLDYEPAQRDQLWELVELAADLIARTLEPQGVNIGINQGRAAGAGVPQHLHVHLVPRWAGDTNVMEVVGRVCVIPASLEAMAERYRAAWALLRAERSSLRPPGGA